MDSQEVYEYDSTVTPPLSLVAAIVCGTAVVLSYAFPKQRKFPNVVLVWCCLGDFFTALFICLKWVPGPLKQIFTANISPAICFISVYWELVLEVSSCVVCALTAYTLFAAIVQNTHLEKLRKNYYWFLGFVLGTSFLLPLIPFTDFDNLTKKIAFILPVLRYVYVITASIKTLTPDRSVVNRARVWLGLRLLGGLCNQLTFWFCILLYESKVFLGMQISESHVIFMGIVPICLSLNGFIVLFGNRSLRNLFKSSTLLGVWEKIGILLKPQDDATELDSDA